VEEFDIIKLVDEIFVSFAAKKKLVLNEERKRIVAETKL